MDYNVNEINVFLKAFNPEHFTEADVDTFLEEMTRNESLPEFGWDSGATKFVIMPKGKDYVIKIPFDGEYNEESDDYEFVYYYNGAGKEGWDYCELEIDYFWDYIDGSGFEQFFLTPETVVDAKGDWPIYIQKKATPCNENRKVRYSSVDSLYKVRTTVGGWTRLPDEWLALCLENLDNDVEKLKEFIDFLKGNFSDLHEGNIGYCGNQAVILDFAGFGH